MVSSVSNPGLIEAAAAAARPGTAGNAAGRINPKLGRDVALTAKFGPDPGTGSPLQLIAGSDVEAAETNDLRRLAEANLGLSSAENLFQAQSIRSDQELAIENGISGARQVAQEALTAKFKFAAQTNGIGINDFTQRGNSIDIQV